MLYRTLLRDLANACDGDNARDLLNLHALDGRWASFGARVMPVKLHEREAMDWENCFHLILLPHALGQIWGSFRCHMHQLPLHSHL